MIIALAASAAIVVAVIAIYALATWFLALALIEAVISPRY